MFTLGTIEGSFYLPLKVPYEKNENFLSMLKVQELITLGYYPLPSQQ
jgi:hypothetical protein